MARMASEPEKKPLLDFSNSGSGAGRKQTRPVCQRMASRGSLLAKQQKFSAHAYLDRAETTHKIREG